MRWRGESGVTLIELCVILAVITVLAVAVYPSISNLRELMGAKGASEEVAGAVRQARQYAVTRGLNHCIVFAGNPTTFAIHTVDNGGNCDAGTPTVQSAVPIGHNLSVVIFNPSLPSQTLVFNPVGTLVQPVVAGFENLEVGHAAGQCPRNNVAVSRFGGVRVTELC
jgi:Tfp pilus assembly protein FimT